MQAAQVVVTNSFALESQQPQEGCHLKQGLLLSHLEGSASVQQLLQLQELSFACCQSIGLFVRQALLRAFE